MQKNPANEQNKNINGISPVGEEKVYGEKDMPDSQVLSSEWKTKWVREDKSGDSEDGEDDELPCVIGESEEDCIWQSIYCDHIINAQVLCLSWCLPVSQLITSIRLHLFSHLARTCILVCRRTKSSQQEGQVDLAVYCVPCSLSYSQPTSDSILPKRYTQDRTVKRRFVETAPSWGLCLW